MNWIPPSLQEFIVRVLLVVLAFGLILLFRGLLTHLVLRPIQRLATRTNRSLDDNLILIVTSSVRLLLFAVWLDIAVRILALDARLGLFVNRVSQTLVIVALLVAIYRIVGLIGFSRNRLYSLTGITIEDTLLPFVRTGFQLFIFAVGLVMVIQTWGYDVTGLVAGLGIGGLALSLAAQDTLSNLFGFSMIVSDRPFVVGEFIKTPDVEGTVEHVGLRSTRVRQLDQALVTVPNSKLAGSAILNWSRLSKRWIDLKLRISYDTSADDMEYLLGQIRALLLARPEVEPESVLVRFISFGDTGLEILVRCYLRLPDWGEFTAVRETINLEILRLVRRAERPLEFGQPTIHVDLPDETLNVTVEGQEDDHRPAE